MKKMIEKTIRALVMDVDGTLTDGGIYLGNSGEELKRFYVRDGLAIKHILPEYGIVPIVITGRSSALVSRRCEELDIADVVQGCGDKLAALERMLAEKGISFGETAYIGDDVNDLECMKKAGLSGCPADAVKDVLETADYVCSNRGGYGAVREFIDHIISTQPAKNSEQDKKQK